MAIGPLRRFHNAHVAQDGNCLPTGFARGPPRMTALLRLQISDFATDKVRLLCALPFEAYVAPSMLLKALVLCGNGTCRS